MVRVGHPILRSGCAYEKFVYYIPVYNTYSLCFISIGKELHKVQQQTEVYNKQQQFGTDVASILS